MPLQLLPFAYQLLPFEYLLAPGKTVYQLLPFQHMDGNPLDAIPMGICFSQDGGHGHRVALKVGFMLRALLYCYSVIVTDFCLGCHSLTSTTLQTVEEHCTSYNKDP